jgi:hypothetical protein
MNPFKTLILTLLGVFFLTSYANATPPSPTLLASTTPLRDPCAREETDKPLDSATTARCLQKKKLNEAKEWVLSFIRNVAPPGRKVYYPEGQETKELAETRYDSIAKDLLGVIYHPKTKPLFTGPYGRARTLAVVLSVMMHESSFMRHVDYGLGKYAKGDQGKSVCLMQIFVDEGRTMRWNTVENRPVKWNDPTADISNGYTGDEILSDRQICIREGMKVLLVSFGGTKGMPLDERLRIYASGSRDKGAESSRNRMRTAMQWYAKSFRNQFTDAEVMAAVKAENYFVQPHDFLRPSNPLNVL